MLPPTWAAAVPAHSSKTAQAAAVTEQDWQAG